MRILKACLAVSAMLVSTSGLFAQQLQIPTVTVPNGTAVKASGTVTIQSRKDAQHAGRFKFMVAVKYSPQADAYPSGNIELCIDLSDTMADGLVDVKVPESGFLQVTSVGKHTPTAFLYAKCDYGRNVEGYLWMMLADNKEANAGGTPDVVQFVLLDKSGKRIAYGCGFVDRGGDVAVGPGGA